MCVGGGEDGGGEDGTGVEGGKGWRNRPKFSVVISAFRLKLLKSSKLHPFSVIIAVLCAIVLFIPAILRFRYLKSRKVYNVTKILPIGLR